MMKMKYVLGAVMMAGLLCCHMAIKAASPGELISYKVIQNLSTEELKAFFKKQHIPKIIFAVNQGINIYDVLYTTTYADGSVVKASGLVYVPVMKGKELPIMTYNHGTEMCRDRTCFEPGETSIDLAFATDGYIVLTPDYIGLGEGERTQLFLNTQAEAHATIDMLLAVKTLLAQLEVKTNGQLFVTGYSQGGHAAMATAKMLQEKYAASLPVTASAPMSGPYDIAATVYNQRNSHVDYPGFLMLLLQSYYSSIGKFNELKNVLVYPYDSIMPPLLNGEYSLDDISAYLPDPAFKAIKPDFYNAFVNDSTSPFRMYLKNNCDYDWKPEMPMQLCYCNGDEIVDYHNSITAYNTMKRNGSDNVQLWRAGKKFGHENCALFAVVYTKMFFDGFRYGKPGTHGPAFKRLLLTIGKLAVKAR
jgi:pimeloyl-ACP methyl ester carboxylesterase